MDWRSWSEKNFALISSPNGLIHNVQAMLANFGRRVKNAERRAAVARKWHLAATERRQKLCKPEPDVQGFVGLIRQQK